MKRHVVPKFLVFGKHEALDFVKGLRQKLLDTKAAFESPTSTTLPSSAWERKRRIGTPI